MHIDPIHEGQYHKTIKELGAFGLLVLIVFFIITIREIFLSIRSLEDNNVSLFCAVVLAFFLLQIIMGAKGAHIFTKYPSNFLFYFLFGITIKLRYLNLSEDIRIDEKKL